MFQARYYYYYSDIINVMICSAQILPMKPESLTLSHSGLGVSEVLPPDSALFGLQVTMKLQ